jgi:membrane protein implicated in regulation of membrane protease activity
MKFGKRLNVSGVVGLLLIPMIVLLAMVPLAATAAGYVAQSVLLEYATLAILAALSLVFYLLLLPSQGEAVQKRELAIHDAVNDPGND